MPNIYLHSSFLMKLHLCPFLLLIYSIMLWIPVGLELIFCFLKEGVYLMFFLFVCSFKKSLDFGTSKRGCKWKILCTYIRNAKIVMHGLYYIHIWHLNLPCGFAENSPAIACWWKQITCITHLIITWRNKWVCKIGKSANKL